jgi:hypothetical protein
MFWLVFLSEKFWAVMARFMVWGDELVLGYLEGIIIWQGFYLPDAVNSC